MRRLEIGCFSCGKTSCGHYPGGHFSGGHFSGGHFSGEHFSGGHFSCRHYPCGHFSCGHYPGGHSSGGHSSGGHYSGGHSSGGHSSGGYYVVDGSWDGLVGRACSRGRAYAQGANDVEIQSGGNGSWDIDPVSGGVHGVPLLNIFSQLGHATRAGDNGVVAADCDNRTCSTSLGVVEAWGWAVVVYDTSLEGCEDHNVQIRDIFNYRILVQLSIVNINCTVIDVAKLEVVEIIGDIIPNLIGG